MDDELTIKDVAAREGVTRQTVHNWLTRGLPSRMDMRGLAPKRIIAAEDLDLWLAKMRNAK